MDLFTYANELTQPEESRLAELETTIKQGLSTFVDVGMALMEIRDSRLYRKEYNTFEWYCQEKWGMVRQNANRLIAAAETVKLLEPIGSIPATESQARPLTSLEPEQQREAWARAVETAPNGKVTAAHVQSVVDEIKGDDNPVSKPHVSFNSGENEWYTPKEYIEAARLVMGGIDLDPASSDIANRTVRADTYYTKENDGLLRPWFGRLWMNPPYSSDLIKQFVDMLYLHTVGGDIEQAIVLVNNATETKWFQTLFDLCGAVCFLSGRVKFIDTNGVPSGAPLQGQAVVYIGNKPEVFAKHYGEFGKVLYTARRDL